MPCIPAAAIAAVDKTLPTSGTATLPPSRPSLSANDAELIREIVRETRGEPAPLLDIHAVARWLNVSTRLVETFVAGGEIPSLRIGRGRGVRRFEPAAVEAFIRRRAKKP